MTTDQIKLAEDILDKLNVLDELGVREGTIDEATNEAFEYNGFTVAEYLEAIS